MDCKDEHSALGADASGAYNDLPCTEATMIDLCPVTPVVSQMILISY